jgi:hypothetical protein
LYFELISGAVQPGIFDPPLIFPEAPRALRRENRVMLRPNAKPGAPAFTQRGVASYDRPDDMISGIDPARCMPAAVG